MFSLILYYAIFAIIQAVTYNTKLYVDFIIKKDKPITVYPKWFFAVPY